jgi:CubicO group peptidase (beta-lactamase class C family)
MAGRTPINEEIAAPNAETTPENQAATVRNQDLVWPVRAIRRGEAVRPLPLHARALADLTFEAGDLRLSIGDYMARRRTAGLLILKVGEIALERYGMGNVPESLWTGFGTATSMTGTLVGAALHDGAIDSLDDACDFYLRPLLGSGYEGVTIRNLLRMCSGVAWREENVTDGRSDVRRLGRAIWSRRPGAILDLLGTLPRAQPQGCVFNYSTVESCLLAALVAAATGRPLTDYCAETIWAPAGMEADGNWQLEAEDGLELGGLGVSACLPMSAASPNWCWRTAKRSMACGSSRPAGAISPASPTARPPPSASSCPGRPRDTDTNGGRRRTCPVASATAPFRREAAMASSSTSIRPSRWSL